MRQSCFRYAYKQTGVQNNYKFPFEYYVSYVRQANSSFVVPYPVLIKKQQCTIITTAKYHHTRSRSIPVSFVIGFERYYGLMIYLSLRTVVWSTREYVTVIP